MDVSGQEHLYFTYIGIVSSVALLTVSLLTCLLENIYSFLS